MALTLCDFVNSDRILWDLNATSRKQAIGRLVERAAEELSLDSKKILSAVMAREKLGSTGVGDGVAIPHARLEGIIRPAGYFARLKTSVDFEAVDDRPCDLVFLLLAPPNGGADHLRALAQVARLFRQARMRESLRRAETAEDALMILCNRPLQSAVA